MMWFVRICMESVIGSTKHQLRQVSTSPSEDSKPAVTMWPPTILNSPMQAIGFILSSSRLAWGYGLLKEMLIIACQLQEQWLGSFAWKTNLAYQLLISGENGGLRASINSKIRLEVWFGNWKDSHSHRLKEQVIWCQRTRRNKQL